MWHFLTYGSLLTLIGHFCACWTIFKTIIWLWTFISQPNDNKKLKPKYWSWLCFENFSFVVHFTLDQTGVNYLILCGFLWEFVGSKPSRSLNKQICHLDSPFLHWRGVTCQSDRLRNIIYLLRWMICQDKSSEFVIKDKLINITFASLIWLTCVHIIPHIFIPDKFIYIYIYIYFIYKSILHVDWPGKIWKQLYEKSICACQPDASRLPLGAYFRKSILNFRKFSG